ncbi:uncharacterized protein N7479_009150 [Penicillium vulpinum]|uniref:uncharacterized protein n=1 Tax=Penicillium vulpinum TaxID=29845 RepID=UPI00254882FF|nr:uncharacterized protein N7479_009150 [Penicillium vulpinum]KAJ5950737.1 hypothetical protein N7479_009150 [Penicillium vulpinum]
MGILEWQKILHLALEASISQGSLQWLATMPITTSFWMEPLKEDKYLNRSPDLVEDFYSTPIFTDKMV